MMIPPLVDDSPSLGCSNVEKVLDGTYQVPEGTNEFAIKFLEQLKMLPDVPIDGDIGAVFSVEQHIAGWKRMRSSTNSSPFGNSFLDYIAACDDKEVATIGELIGFIPCATGIIPKGWMQVMDSMIPKKKQQQRRQSKQQQQQQLMVNQFVLTPGVGSLVDVGHLLLGLRPSLRPTSLAHQVQHQLKPFLHHHATESWNVIMMDSIRRRSAIMDFLVGMSFPGTLKILYATTCMIGTDQHVTRQLELELEPFLHDNRVLYIPNLWENLVQADSSSSSTTTLVGGEQSLLLICFQLDEQDAQVLEVDLRITQDLVNSPYQQTNYNNHHRYGRITPLGDSNSKLERMATGEFSLVGS